MPLQLVTPTLPTDLGGTEIGQVSHRNDDIRPLVISRGEEAGLTLQTLGDTSRPPRLHARGQSVSPFGKPGIGVPEHQMKSGKVRWVFRHGLGDGIPAEDHDPLHVSGR